MKVEFEIVKPDEGSCFRFLHQKVRIKDFVWAYHYHPEIEITCVIGGSGTRHVGNHLSNYDNGELVLIGSKLPHSGFGLNSNDPHEEIVLQIPENVLNYSFQTYPEMQNITELLEKAKYGISFKGAIKEQITRQLIDLTTCTAFQKYIGLLEILQIMSNASSDEYILLNKQALDSNIINRHKVRLQKIFTYVEKNYNEEIDLQKIATIVGLSIPSFCNYFKKTTMISFTEFVNRYRVQRACLLMQQDKTIAEASFESGFNNVTYFNKVFKDIMKKTPSSFKKERFETIGKSETIEL